MLQRKHCVRLCVCLLIRTCLLYVQQFMDKVDELSSQALRVLAIACVHLGLFHPPSPSPSASASLSPYLSLCCGPIRTRPGQVPSTRKSSSLPVVVARKTCHRVCVHLSDAQPSQARNCPSTRRKRRTPSSRRSSSTHAPSPAARASHSAVSSPA